MRLKLAGLGSATWLAQNGKKTPAEVADAVRIVEGEHEKLSERVAIFIRELTGQRLVKLTLRTSAPASSSNETDPKER